MLPIKTGLLLSMLCLTQSAVGGPSIDLIMNDPTQFKTPENRCNAEVCKAWLYH